MIESWNDYPKEPTLPTGWTVTRDTEAHSITVGAPEHLLYVDIAEASVALAWRAALHNLGGAVFNKEHPGFYPKKIMEFMLHGPKTPEDKIVWARYQELSFG